MRYLGEFTINYNDGGGVDFLVELVGSVCVLEVTKWSDVVWLLWVLMEYISQVVDKTLEAQMIPIIYLPDRSEPRTNTVWIGYQGPTHRISRLLPFSVTISLNTVESFPPINTDETTADPLGFSSLLGSIVV